MKIMIPCLTTSRRRGTEKNIRRRIRRRTEAITNLIISELTKKKRIKTHLQKNIKKALTNLEKSSKIKKVLSKEERLHSLPIEY
ncbi:hypothetical protein, partial [Porcipelethomonas sp.]|uniref:hypothetical protein n=1 Tax=Porcipelethomonas sp. TaxID=2981675 RepID=UPI003EF82332